MQSLIGKNISSVNETISRLRSWKKSLSRKNIDDVMGLVTLQEGLMSDE